MGRILDSILAMTILIGAIAACESRAANATTRDSRTGAYAVVFTERAAASDIEAMGRRLGWTARSIEKSGQERDYDLAKESFEVCVPESYHGDVGWGLFVYVSPGASGSVPPAWRGVLEKHKLIWVAPNRAGNERAVWCRVGLAINAAVNMRKRYKVDEDRVYIGGVSGGGRIASMAGVCYPDLFCGAYPMIGCNFYRTLPSVEQAGRVFRQTFTLPPAHLMEWAKKRSRLVLLTGQSDPNREQTKVNSEAFKKDGFQHVRYIEVPGMGHQAPDAEWFEKGIEALELPAKPGDGR